MVWRKRWVLGLAALVGSGMADPAAGQDNQGPSFECENAGGGIEAVICTDPVLAPLDAAMAKAYQARRAATRAAAEKDALLADQRAWLRNRTVACPVPDDPETDASALFRAVPCLIKLYRQRVTALGGTPPQQPPANAATGDDLHPFCLAPLVPSLEDDPDTEVARPPVDLAACRAGTAHIPVEIKDRYHSADRTNFAYPAGYLAYASAGRTADGLSVYEVYDNGGGSGLFSTLLVVRNDGRQLHLVHALAFGDRCSGGLSDANTLPGGKVQARSHLTPGDFGALMATAAGRAKDDPIYQDLPSCAVCCYAVEVHTIAPDTGRRTLVGFEVPATEEEMIKDSPAAVCLDRAIRATAPTGTAELKPAQLAALDARFRKCVRP